jgi:hypothetical protein
MVDLLSSKNSNMMKNALSYVGSILTSDNVMVANKCHLNGVIDRLTNLLYDVDYSTVKKACWAISNFAATAPEFAAIFVKSSAYHRCLVLAESSPNIDIQEEALWALTNALTTGNQETLRDAFFCDSGASDDSAGQVVYALLKGLKLKTSRLVANVVETLLKLQELDAQLNMVGSSSSVYSKMKHYDAP